MTVDKQKIRLALGQRKIAEVGLEGHLGFLRDVVKTWIEMAV